MSERVSFGVVISEQILLSVDKELGQLAMLSRMPAIKKGLKRVCEVVKKRVYETLPKPGYPGDKPGKTPLRDALRTKVKEYPNGKVLGLVGFDYERGGQHGHLAELGHAMVTKAGKTVGVVEGKFYLAHAAAATESEQQTAMEESIQQAIAEAKRG